MQIWILVMGVLLLIAIVTVLLLWLLVWQPKRRGNINDVANGDEEDAEVARPSNVVQRWLRRRHLRRQAILDYKNARGTSHLEMLRTAMRNVRRRREQYEHTIKSLKSRKSTLERERQAELVAQLQSYLVRYRLDEARGIGTKLKQRIVRQVFRGRLEDLYQTQRVVVGVGQSKQYAINSWVTYYKQRLPRLLQEDFPGKGEIIANYREVLLGIAGQIKRLEAQRQTLMELESRVNQKTTLFSQVHKQDLIQALLEEEDYSEEIELYLQGLFAPWEPMPDWFRQALEEGRTQ